MRLLMDEAERSLVGVLLIELHHVQIGVILQGPATELHVIKTIPRPLALDHLPLLAVVHVLMKLSDFIRLVDIGVLGLDLSEGHRGDHLLLAGCLFGLRMLLCLYRKNRHGLSGWLERF